MNVDALSHLLTQSLPLHGEPNGDGPWWQVWNADPQILIPGALAAFFYLNGLRRWQDRSRHHSMWRTASYLGGLALLLLVLESPLDHLSEHHFTFHMIQHELILMLVVPLILLGAPTTPSLLGLPRPLRMSVLRPLLGSRAVRMLYGLMTRPLIAASLLIVTLYLWHLAPGWYDSALSNELVHAVQHGSYLVVGVLFPNAGLGYFVSWTSNGGVITSLASLAPPMTFAIGLMLGRVLTEQYLAGSHRQTEASGQLLVGRRRFLGLSLAAIVGAARASAAARIIPFTTPNVHAVSR